MEFLKLLSCIILAAVVYETGYIQGKLSALRFVQRCLDEAMEEAQKKQRNEKRNNRENQEV